MSESVKHVAQIGRSEIQLTTSCPPADVRNGKIQWIVVQVSIVKKMKHDAINDNENDDASDANDNHMKNQELDGAFCENVLESLDKIIPKLRFRDSADQFGLVDIMESDPLEARNKSS